MPAALEATAPDRLLVTIRNVKPIAPVRLPNLGVLSITNSKIAQTVSRMTNGTEATNQNGPFETSSHPRYAAQLTTAGAVIDRSPATMPIPKLQIRNSSFTIALYNFGSIITHK
jgi:hypothetical protein